MCVCRVGGRGDVERTATRSAALCTFERGTDRFLSAACESFGYVCEQALRGMSCVCAVNLVYCVLASTPRLYTKRHEGQAGGAG